MHWFFILLFLSFTFNNLSDASQEKELPSAVVVGTVYCDTCFQQDFSKNSHFISGASVAVECKDVNSRPSFTKEVKTDEHGEFKVHLPFSVSKQVKKIKRCEVELISSNEPYCAVASTAKSSSLHLKSRKQGIHIFSAGFFTFKPQKRPNLCNQKPSIQKSRQFNAKNPSLPPVTNPTFPPLLHDTKTPDFPPLPVPPELLPLPQLSPLPSLPGLPNLPPIPGKTPKTKPAEPFDKTQLAEQEVVHAEAIPTPQFFPPNPFQPPSIFPPNPFQPPPLLPPLLPPNPFQPPPAPSIFPPNPFQPPPLLPPLLPPNPFQPPPAPSIFPPNPFQPPPLLPPLLPPNPIQPPPAPFFPFPPIPGLTPSPPPPSLPIPFPPFLPFPPLPPLPFPPPPRIPGIPPASSLSSSQKTSP